MGIKKLFNRQSFSEAPKLFSVLLDQFFMSLTTLLISIVLARTYDKIDYAELILLFSINLFVLGFQSSLISKPYAINLNDFSEDIEKIRYYQFSLRLKYIFTALVFIFFPLLYYFMFDNWNIEKLLFYLLYIIGYTSYFFVRETLLSERKTKQNMVYGLFCSSGLITLLALIYFNKITNVNYFLGIASIIYLSVTIFYFFKNQKKARLLKAKYVGYFLKNWKVGKWLVGSNFFFYLSSSIYPWLLLYITNKSDIATLGVLLSIASLVNPILSALSSYLLPLFVKVNLDYQKIDGMVKRWTLIFAGLSFSLASIGYFLGEYLIVVLFSKKYAGLGILAVYPFIVQAINVIFQPIKISLNAIKRTDINFWILMPRSFISITLGYFLITEYGLVGVFYTMIVENLFYQVVNYIIYKSIMMKNKPLSKS